MRFRILPLAAALALTLSAAPAAADRYGWQADPPARVLETAFAAPPDADRVAVPAGSFAAWLRTLPLKEQGARVLLHDGRQRADQSGAAAVIDIDVGRRDLQQCADAVIRLRAEWLHAGGRRDALAFDFTSGDRYAYAAYLRGKRPVVSGNRVSWRDGGPVEDGRDGLRRWLDIVFTYAGSLSLQRELVPVASVRQVQPGDVLIQGGSPGHAVIVLDVARAGDGRPFVLLAQSFMPAQSIHVLRNRQGGVWHELSDGAMIDTPDWRFASTDLRRFAAPH
ncbi:MAG: DUF4846 domain-containing protein [Reyranellaceae bacterium]